MRDIAKNDITGKYIKSEPPNQAFRDGWDNIFAKTTPEEWSRELYPESFIKSYDGFRDIDFDTALITKSDFNKRFMACTVLLGMIKPK